MTQTKHYYDEHEGCRKRMFEMMDHVRELSEVREVIQKLPDGTFVALKIVGVYARPDGIQVLVQ